METVFESGGMLVGEIFVDNMVECAISCLQEPACVATSTAPQQGNGGGLVCSLFSSLNTSAEENTLLKKTQQCKFSDLSGFVYPIFLAIRMGFPLSRMTTNDSISPMKFW